VDRVIRDSPADRYGIKPRDVILVIDDENVSKSNQIQAIIARKSPEDVIHVVLFRAGREMDIDVKLQKRETSLSSFASNRSPQKFRNLGIRCESLTVERAERQNYTGLSGVVITQIERLSPADDAGMNEGDIIIEIGQHPIENKADFLKTLSAMTAGTVAIFRIIRNGEESHIFVNIPG
ncbi:MAG: PDZ domain-containing protein, partial [bacterium]